MVKAEFAVLMKAYISLYPGTKFFTDPKTAEVWYQLLCDLSYNDLSQALTAHAKSNKFPPTVAELREGVKQVGIAKIAEQITVKGSSMSLPDKSGSKIREFDTYEEMYAACGSNYTLAELEHVLLLQAERIHKDESLRKANAGLLEQKAGDMRPV